MLTALRASARSWVAKILIGVLVLSFAVWGISDVFTGFGADQVAEAGDTPISAAQFQRNYQTLVQRMSQQMGRGITPTQARALGLPQQVLGDLVTEALLLDAAAEFGIGVSDETLARSIRDNEMFQGPTGAFDRFLFERVLAANDFTEEAFIEAERRVVARQQLADGLVGGLAAPETWLAAVNAFQNEERAVAFVRLTRDSVGPVADPAPDELAAWFEENRGRFRAPEYRAVSLLELSPETIADPAAVPADEVRRAYDASTAFGEPERRRVLQIVFSDDAAAGEAMARLQAGESIEAVVAALERAMADVDLGLVEASAIVDPAVREAAFAMAAGENRVVAGRFGPVLVRVAEVEPARKRPFETVEADIRRDLALDRAAREAVDLYDLVEDAFAGGSTVAEVGERFGITVRSVPPVDRTGLAPDGPARDHPGGTELLVEVFDTDVGVENAPIESGRTSYVWYRVEDVIPARDRTLEEVEGEVIAAWTAARISTELDALAKRVADRLRAGETVAAVAASIPGATAEESGRFSRANPAGLGTLPEMATAAAFEGPEGHVADVVAEDGSHVVLAVTSVLQPAFFPGAADLAPIRNELNQAIGDTLLTSYVNALQRDRGVTLNQPLIDRIVGLGES